MVAALHHHPPQFLANARLKDAYTSWLWGSVAFAVLVHFLVLAFGSLQIADWSRPAPPAFIGVDYFDVPPPPEPVDIPRPLVPALGSFDIDSRLTIDPPAWRDAVVAPPPPAPVRDAEGMPWVPREVEPRLLNAPEIRAAMLRDYPPLLRNAGIGGNAVFHVFVDVNGRIGQARLASSSGSPELDRAAERVLQEMRFAPARNMDQPVGVWVALPVRFEVQR